MNLIQTLYHITHHLGYALLVAVLLPVVVAAQSLTKERLPQYSGAHRETLADTTRFSSRSMWQAKPESSMMKYGTAAPGLAERT
jgi:hypothetical protein